MTLSHLLIIIFVQLAQLVGILDLTYSTKAKLKVLRTFILNGEVMLKSSKMLTDMSFTS